MVKVFIGDIFDSNAQTLVNTVNCVGIMGKGIALEFKKRFPEMHKDYVERCARREVKLGRPYIFAEGFFKPRILNFPTKDHWRSITKLSDIEQGLQYLIDHYKEWGIESLAVPPLGCGQGQLEWRVVGPTLYRYLSKLDIPVELYAPYGTPHEELRVDFLAIKREGYREIMPEPEFVKPAWVALVEALRIIENEPYHWPIGRTSFQKMAYVATLEGLPTDLNFKRGSYGPFAHELKLQVSRLANNGLIEEQRLGRMLAVKVGPTFDDAKRAYCDSLERWSDVINRIADLFCRISSNQSEIVATVLFSADQLKSVGQGTPTEMDVLNDVKQWKQRRRPPLDDLEFFGAIRNLAALGWLDVKPSQDIPLPKESFDSA